MQIINPDILYQGKVEDSILIHSYEEYKEKGGKLDLLDLYAKMIQRAERLEWEYLTTMDQEFSGLPVPEGTTRKQYLTASAYWYIIHIWFNKPLHKVLW